MTPRVEHPPPRASTDLVSHGVSSGAGWNPTRHRTGSLIRVKACLPSWGGQPDVVFPSRRDEAATPTGQVGLRLHKEAQSVISLIAAAASAATSVVMELCIAISFIMSPSALIRPAMKAWVPA